MQIEEVEKRIRLLLESVRFHKRAVRHHREMLRSCQEDIAKLREICEQHGITLTIQGEGMTHGPPQT